MSENGDVSGSSGEVQPHSSSGPPLIEYGSSKLILAIRNGGEQPPEMRALLEPLSVMRTPRELLDNNYVMGNPLRERELVEMYEDAFEGILEPISRHQKVVEDSTSMRRGRAPTDRRIVYNKLAGSDNLSGVTCYLDSLLFAMFARLSNFEPILYRTNHGNVNRNNLALYLRLYVNMMRRGKLITTDITRWVLSAIFRAGWNPSATQWEQQDSAELFIFITETLSMPLLTLKVDIAHAGKPDADDDHQLINERLLLVPLPGSPQDPPILLEECLELYFSNSVEVSRQIERRRASEISVNAPYRPRSFSLSMQFRPSSISSGTDGLDTLLAGGVHRERSLGVRTQSYSPLREASPSSQTGEPRPPASPGIPSSSTLFNVRSTQLLSRERSSSSAAESYSSSRGSTPELQLKGHATELGASSPRKLPEHGESYEQFAARRGRADSDLSVATPPPSYSSLYEHEKPPVVPHSKNPLWTANNEITLPAWMFLQLLPFYSGSGVDEVSPEGPARVVADHFGNARPLLGICLKRYSWTNSGQSVRNDRRVVVPKSISMPSFVADDSDKEGNLFGRFKLVLESAVFHRGHSIHSGHFVALVAEDAAVDFEDDNDDRSIGVTVEAKDSSGAGARERKAGLFRSRSHRRSHRFRNSIRLSRSQGPAGTGKDPKGSDRTLAVRDEERRWLLFDDLQPAGQKFQEVDFDAIFNTETPYLLFYRLVALDDESDGLDPVRTSNVDSVSMDESSLSGEGTLVGTPDLSATENDAELGRSPSDMSLNISQDRGFLSVPPESTQEKTYFLRSGLDTRESLFDSIRPTKNIFRIGGRRSRASSPRGARDTYDSRGGSPSRHSINLGQLDAERRRKLSDPSRRYRDEKCIVM